MMKRSLAPLLILAILSFALYRSQSKPKGTKAHPVSSTYLEHIRRHKRSHMEEELERLHTDAYTQRYIIDVINHGSSQLRFKENEVMEEGFASKEDAPKIACYVMGLSGKKCKEPYPEDAAMFYTSNCGGCHGDDGKGLGGTYPDLTRSPLLGIEKREAFLKSML